MRSRELGNQDGSELTCADNISCSYPGESCLVRTPHALNNRARACLDLKEDVVGSPSECTGQGSFFAVEESRGGPVSILRLVHGNVTT